MRRLLTSPRKTLTLAFATIDCTKGNRWGTTLGSICIMIEINILAVASWSSSQAAYLSNHLAIYQPHIAASQYISIMCMDQNL
jgi:hypothetical protein